MMYNYIIENYTNGEPIFLKELPGESRDYLRQEMKKMKDPVAVVFEEAANRSAAYKEGELIGECEFSVSEQMWIIDHTGVRPAYGGQGIAKRLVEKVIEEARARQIKILPLCSYASKMMEGKTEYQDVLVIR